MTFAEDPDYLALEKPLYPRQRLILKVFYGLPLTADEQRDLEYLLSGRNKYARAVLRPGETIHTLLLVAGRGSSKTTLMAVVYAYETYRLLSLPSPQAEYGLLKSSKIHLQNAATDEKTSLELFDLYKTLLEHAPWFRRVNYRALEREVRFPKRIRAESLHSNSRSVRGRNTKLALFDEMAFLMESTGAIGGKALWHAVTQAVKTRFIARGFDGRIMGASSGGPARTFFYELCRAAEVTPGMALFQLATWEMVPGLTKNHFAAEFRADEESAEMEIGAQFGAAASKFLTPELVEACVNSRLAKREAGERGVRYFMHLDPGLKSSGYALAVVHKEVRAGREVYIVDHMKSWVGTRSHPVEIAEVENYVLSLCRRFKVVKITVDQFNSAATIQKFERAGLPIEETPFTDQYNFEIYANLKTLIENAQFEVYDETRDPRRTDFHAPGLGPEDYPTLVEQLKELERHNMARRYRVQAPAAGPVRVDDLADAVAAACYQCARSGGVTVVRPVVVVGRNIMSQIAW